MNELVALTVNTAVEGLEELRIGSLIDFHMHQMKVVNFDFTRNEYFPDATAQVIVVEGNNILKGTHIKTPWGIVQVVDKYEVGINDR